MIKYGLMLGLIVSSGLSAMDMSKCAKMHEYLNSSQDQLQEKLDENTRKRNVFNAKYRNQDWYNNPTAKAESDAITDERLALMSAMPGSASIKPHGTTLNQSIVNTIQDDESEPQKPRSMKKCLRRIAPEEKVDDDQPTQKIVESNSNNSGTDKLTFEEIFNAAVVKNSNVGNSPKKMKLIDQDKNHSREEKSLEEQITALQARQNELFSGLTNDNRVALADENDQIEDELQKLYAMRRENQESKI